MADEVITQEIASIARDPMVAAFTSVLEPTDETLKARGGSKGIALYDEIRRDPHAFSVLQKRALEVVSREWMVLPASERRIDKKAAELVEQQLKGLRFDRLTRGLMGAVLKGFAVGEVMWANIGGVWTVTMVKVRKQRRFRFTIDGELRLITREKQMEGEPVPERKFIVHRHSIDDDDDDPYGVGVGSVLYWNAWFKRQVLAIWLRGAERHAAPTVDASYEGAYDPKRQQEVLKALRTMATDAGIVHPSNVTLELLESARGGGGDIFEKIYRCLDEGTSEAVLGETLTTNSGEHGARSLGDIHNEVRVAIAKADADLVSATLNDSLVKWIVELNYPGAGMPTVWRDFSEVEDLDKRVERDKAINEMGYEPKDPESYFGETYGGEWQKKQEKQQTSAEPAVTPIAANEDPDDTFADTEDDPTASLADQLQTLAAPAIDAMLDAIRREVDLAVSYDDLGQRLLKLSAAIGVDDLASLMEQAGTVAELSGRDSVSEDA